jgi:hypothetical protein
MDEQTKTRKPISVIVVWVVTFQYRSGGPAVSSHLFLDDAFLRLIEIKHAFNAHGR